MTAQADSTDLNDYAACAVVLQRCGATHTPAEAHGFAVGLHLARVETPHVSWAQELYSDFDPADVLADECRVLLDRLFSQVFAEPDDAADSFALMLPQELVVDTQRLSAVRDWCAGFLFGIGQAGGRIDAAGSQQAKDILRDIAEFTRLAVDDVDNSSENQSALMEIEEYLRVSVMLLRDELLGRTTPHDAD